MKETSDPDAETSHFRQQKQNTEQDSSVQDEKTTKQAEENGK